MKVSILAVGRLKQGAESELAARYLDRARAAGRGIGLTGFETVELPEERGRDAMRRRDGEAAAMLSRLAPGTRRIVLDERGRTLSSEDLAGRIAAWRDGGGGEAAFLIGGPDGHGDAAREGADLLLSFGAMTWPHQLVRIMLAEQFYRAVTILSGHPYHRA